MQKRSKSHTAFTLVELLVVIGIIAILISILLPTLGRARKASQEMVCQSNLRQFGIAIQMYANANKGNMPQKGPDGSSTSASNKNFFGSPTSGVIGFDDPSLWFNGLAKAVVNKSYYEMLVADQNGYPLAATGANNIFLCPSAAPIASMGTNDSLSADGQFYLLGGKDSSNVVSGTTFKFNMSYVYNSKFTDSIAVPTGPAGLKLSQLRPASTVVAMVEKLSNCGEYMDRAVQAYNTKYPTVYAGKITPQGLDNKIAQPKSNWKRMTTRHRGGGNILFCDGHVQWFAWTEAQVQDDQMPFNAATSDANQPNRMIWSITGAIN